MLFDVLEAPEANDLRNVPRKKSVRFPLNAFVVLFSIGNLLFNINLFIIYILNLISQENLKIKIIRNMC